MIQGLQTALDVSPQFAIAYILVFLRVGATMATVPAFGERMMPLRVRLITSLAFAAIVAPAIAPDLAPRLTNPTTIAAIAGVEVVAGLAIGISLRLFIIALQTAGAIAAQSTSLSQILGGAAVDPQPAIGHVLVVAGLAIAVTAGLHVQIASFLIYSYEILPSGVGISGVDLAQWGTARVARSFQLAFSLAAPFVIASMIYNIALGAINKAMPQLLVSFVGAPAITFGGLALLFLAAPLMLAEWLDVMHIFMRDPFGGQP